ncbi:MAG: hypothetical protein PUD44_03125, partial [Clostridiaceae bacterium]|nr:hypothetical protein [Clostridiaceae bacterium]
IVSSCSFIALLPLMISAAYRIGSGKALLDLPFDSSDILAYVSSIIGAAVAIAGVYLTLKHDRLKAKEDRHASVKPYIVISPQSFDDFFDCDHLDDKNLNLSLERYRNTQTRRSNSGFTPNGINLLFHQGELSFPFMNEMKVKYYSDTKIHSPDDRSIIYIPMPFIFYPYSLQNSGLGIACYLYAQIYRNDEETVFASTQSIFLPANEKTFFDIYLCDRSIRENTYRIVFRYSDMYGRKYLTEYRLTFENAATVGDFKPSLSPVAVCVPDTSPN